MALIRLGTSVNIFGMAGPCGDADVPSNGEILYDQARPTIFDRYGRIALLASKMLL